jgi:DNA polymerase-3 subunit gamma/tau
MSYIALYRKWRPLVFEDVVEQEHVVKTLKNAVKSARIAHAYLFCGTRGTGKTSMAKIFSRAINCLNPRDGDPCNECDICRGILSGSLLDVIEIDAASNNSVDNIRDIRDEVIYTPSSAKYKVYIIDEVHMLSSGAFNALLKTLEEPPSHAVFILATTEPHKLPATILSRCQRFDFRRIPIESIMGRLDRIAEASGVSLHKEASKLIAKMADGALRDAISILDQCMAVGAKEVSYEDVLTVVGIVNDTFISEIVDAINSKDINHILKMVEKLVMDGKDISKFVSDLVLYYRNLLICKITDKPEEIIDVTPDAVENMKRRVFCPESG